jgi:hypothetical protein
LSYALFISCDPLGCRRRHRHRRPQSISVSCFFFRIGFSSNDFELTATIEIQGIKEERKNEGIFFSILFFLIEFIGIYKRDKKGWMTIIFEALQFQFFFAISLFHLHFGNYKICFSFN